MRDEGTSSRYEPPKEWLFPLEAARTAASGALLPGSRGMVIFGGEFGNTALADAWVLRPVARP